MSSYCIFGWFLRNRNNCLSFLPIKKPRLIDKNPASKVPIIKRHECQIKPFLSNSNESKIHPLKVVKDPQNPMTSSILIAELIWKLAIKPRSPEPKIFAKKSLYFSWPRMGIYQTQGVRHSAKLGSVPALISKNMTQAQDYQVGDTFLEKLEGASSSPLVRIRVSWISSSSQLQKMPRV